MPARYYLQALRDWASRVARERYPHHIAISVDGRVRLKAWLSGNIGDETMVMLECLRNAWNTSDSLADIGHIHITDNVLTITAQPGMWRAFNITTIPPSPWRPRHALAWCVGKLLPGPAGWVVREVMS